MGVGTGMASGRWPQGEGLRPMPPLRGSGRGQRGGEGSWSWTMVAIGPPCLTLSPAYRARRPRPQMPPSRDSPLPPHPQCWAGPSLAGSQGQCFLIQPSGDLWPRQSDLVGRHSAGTQLSHCPLGGWSQTKTRWRLSNHSEAWLGQRPAGHSHTPATRLPTRPTHVWPDQFPKPGDRTGRK